ncbi:MAG: helix-turn-helix domain-containing protein [Pseudorhodobacter sp.]
MPLSGLTGTRLRERRLALGLKQADLAREVGVSPSFLNLIEHNRRRISAPVLERLAVALRMDPADFAEGAERGRIEDLRAAAADGEIRPELDRVEDFLGRFPGWADLAISQHRRLGRLERVVSVLNDRIGHDPHLSAALHEVLSAVSSVRSTAAILAETEEIEPDWRARFHANLHADSERLAQGAEALVAYLDSSGETAEAVATAPQDELEAWLSGRGWHLAELEEGGAGPAALEREVTALASGAARELARGWIARAQDDALRLPLDVFEATLEQMEGDPLRVARKFGVGGLAVFRRLAFRPGVQEGLVMCDASGTLIIRKPLAGFTLPRFGAACPLWPLFTALARPMEPVEAVADLPGPSLQRYRLRAYSEPEFPGGFGSIALRRAAMLIEPAAPGEADVIPIGSSCRICPRSGCVARREPSIMSEWA